MSKLFFILLSLICTNLLAQDWDEEKHEHKGRHEYRRDYFTIGLYTGSYIGMGTQIEKNFYFNSIAAEIEYVKFRDLSLYARGIYQFSNVKIPNYIYYGAPYGTQYLYYEPSHYKMVISFGGRYYVRKEGKVRPYLQLGINQETQFQENTKVDYLYPDGSKGYITYYDGGYDFYYFMNIGVGFTVKISNKFTFDMKYDLNKSLDKKSYSFNGFSVLGGIKYNL